MRKEIVLFERNEDGGYVDPEGFNYSEFDVDEYAEWKRFKDAELAATYFMIHSTVMQFLGYMDPKGSPADLRARDAQRRLAIVERFATLPHFDDEVV